jgi:hypothetical protein
MRLAEFLRVSAPLLVSWSVQVGSVYLLLLALPRLLRPSDYSAAASVLSVYLVLTGASIALQARQAPAGVSTSESRTVSTKTVIAGRRFPSWALVAGLAVLVATPALSAILHVPAAPISLLAPAFLVSLLTSDRIRALRRSGARSRMAIALGAGAAIRVAMGFVLVSLDLNLLGVVVAIVMAELVTLAVSAYRDRDQRNDEHGRASTAVPAGTQLQPTVAAVVAVVLLAHLDIAFAQQRLPSVEAGQYAGAAVFTRVLLFLPVIGALLVLQRKTTMGHDDPFRWLHRSLAATGLSLIACGAALVLFRAPLTAVVLGGQYDGASALVPLLAAVAGLLAMVWQLSLFHIVVESKAHVLILTVVVVEVVLLGFFASTPRGVAGMTLVCAGTAALLHYIGAWAVARWSPPLTRLRPHEELASSASPPLRDAVELSMILPCYNPGPTLHEFLDRLSAGLRHEEPYEIIVVSDGSTDDSVGIAQHFPSPSVRVVHYAERSGKGHALRVGLNMARGSYVGFIDSDGDIDPQAIGPFLSLMRLYEPDIILGSKRHPMSDVTYPKLRRLMSWTYHKVTRVLFRINVRDTQTGLKVIRSDVLSAVLPRMFEKRYAFDLELLVVARALGFRKVFEAPVRIDYRFSSKVNPDAVFRILLDTAAVFYRRYILDTYRHAGDRLLLVRHGEADVEGLDRRVSRTS